MPAYLQVHSKEWQLCRCLQLDSHTLLLPDCMKHIAKIEPAAALERKRKASQQAETPYHFIHGKWIR
jgi:hypothetical protein